MIKGYSCSVIGGREMNQDAFLVDNSRSLFAVADGVGGGMGGEIASKMVVDGLNELLVPGTPRLTPIFEELQTRVLGYALENYGDALMGTTLTAGWIQGGFLRICHVGDSRCYLLNQGLLAQLTEDQESYDETMQGTVLSSYLGIQTDVHALRIVEDVFPVQNGQRLLFCTDGLSRQMTEVRMAALLKEMNGFPEALVQKLCEEASQREHSDNVTVIYVEIE